MNTNEAEKVFKFIRSQNTKITLKKTRIMIWTLKKIFALFSAKLLWFFLNDDDVALPACRLKYNFFFAENGRSLRFNGDKAF